MKYICSLLLTGIAAAACNSGGKSTPADSGAVKIIHQARPSHDPIGIYTGDFGGSPIYISINFARGKNVAGYNTHKGLRRNLHGEILQDGDAWRLRLEEPGDHPYDGVFDIRLSEDMKTMDGTWEPLQKDSASSKKFTLNRVAGENYEVYMASEENSIQFNVDGSCRLEYYPADSISGGQVNILRGTWTRTQDTFHVNWQKNEQFGKSASQFILHVKREGDDTYIDSLTGDGFIFYQLP
ncbi:hypothetical protein [Chitinophaga sp.]|uniref:hypothetical protein n=1 Tax=Chitinophaga sp. TaxID=1869181 RepID=UPI00261BF277|nr:hypothetical protein [uncultured Chitinophaga sp.]